MSSRWRDLGRAFRRRLLIYRLVARHPQTPRLARWLLVAAIAYAALPFDLIPDWIPVLGLLDDVIILPLLVWLALRMIPPGVCAECEQAVARELEEDVGHESQDD